jgi:hypothetical protein
MSAFEKHRTRSYLAIDFEPNIALGLALHYRAYGHQPNNQGFTLLNRDEHFFPVLGSP